MNEGVAKLLNLAPDALSGAARTYLGYGAHVLRSSVPPRKQVDRGIRSSPNEPFTSAANSLVIAASYYATLCDSDATVAFRAAARCFQSMRRSGSLVLGICGGVSPDVLTRDFDWRAIDLSAPEDVLSVLLFDAWSRAWSQDRMIDIPLGLFRQAHNRADGRVGTSGLPGHLVARFYGEMSEVAHERPPGRRAADSLVAILERYADAVAEASVDAFHWRRLASRLLPMPPEIFAATRVYFQAATEQGIAALREEHLGTPVSAPLEAAAALLTASSSHEEKLVEEAPYPEPPSTLAFLTIFANYQANFRSREEGL